MIGWDPNGIPTPSMVNMKWYSPSQVLTAKHVPYPQLTATVCLIFIITHKGRVIVQLKFSQNVIWNNMKKLINSRWSRQQAIEYMLNHTFITHAEASKEIDRYITWPGQACAYKVGEMKIKELRQEAEMRLGELYSTSRHLFIKQAYKTNVDPE